MALDGIVVSSITSELSGLLTGSRISKIAQPEPDEILLTLKAASGQYRLLLSASASLPLLYLTEKNLPSPMTAPNFCMLLRKHISGGKIVRIWQPSLERIIHFEIEHYNEMGDLCRKDLILELMGKYSNLIFCDDNGTIIDAIKHVNAFTSSVREVLPGKPYFIAVTQEKCDPLATSKEEFLRTVFSKPMPLNRALYSSYTGISPLIAGEMCQRARLDSDESTASVEKEDELSLYEIFDEMMGDVKEKKFTPTVYYEDEALRIPSEFSALPLTMYGDLAAKTFDSPSAMLENFYAEKNAVTRMRQKSADLRRVTTTALERCRKKYDLQCRQLKDTEKREEYRIWGELLHTYGYDAPPGASQLRALNYYTDEEIVIPLDPTKTAAENAKHYFDRYDKLKRTYEALTDQVKETESEISHLDSVLSFLDMAASEEDLAQVKEELTDSGYIRRRPSAKKVKITSRPYHYVSSDGYDIYVGKNNYQNDELTFRSADASDWWFHAKGVPGSHVIVKCGAEMPPDNTFLDAARLAGYYSKKRGDGKIEVDYVRKKEVKKPNGAKPGFVVYYTNYSMMTDGDISGIRLISD